MGSTIAMLGPTAPYRGGIAHYTTRLAAEFAPEHDVEVFNFRRMYPDLLFPGKTQLDESAKPVGFPSRRTLDSIRPSTWARTAWRMARAKPDLAIFQHWHPFFGPSYASVSAALHRLSPSTRRVFLCHNVSPHEGSIVDGGLLQVAYSAADAFLVHAELERGRLAPYLRGRPVAVHPHPLYDIFDDLGPAPTREDAKAWLGIEGPCLLFFGYVRHYKGLDLAVRALPEVLKDRSVTLVSAGEFYEDRAEILDLVRRHGLEGRVQLIDRYIPNEDVTKYFAAADLVVQPYRSATQSGITQIAYAVGRPVLATAVGGLPEVIEDGVTGYLVPPEDPGAIARAVADFFDRERADDMEAAVAEARHRFSWKALADTLLGL